MKNVTSDKATAGEIPVKALKNSKTYFLELINCITGAIRNNKFSDFLKLSDITPVYKIIDPSDHANDRPIGVLP